jgi:hypothetical protein
MKPRIVRTLGLITLSVYIGTSVQVAQRGPSPASNSAASMSVETQKALAAQSANAGPAGGGGEFDR